MAEKKENRTMYFNSYVFILAFLPITVLGYYLINKTKKYQLGHMWLLGASLIFAGYLNVYYVVITTVSVLIGYLFILLVTKQSSARRNKKIYVTAGIVVHVGILLYFKYSNFFIENVNEIFDKEIPFLELLLPLGISFYTFQQIAYLVDCYRDNSVKCGFGEYFLYIMYFPKFLQGPILLHEDMLPALHQEENKKFSWEHFSKGLYAFALGLGKKVLLADKIALIVDAGYNNIAELNAPSALLVIIGYSLQLYFDFSGYCDMAMGVGEMLQIPVPVNFDSPYKAVKVTDIWARWHMTLTRFFTKYIYIPLGGNRKGNLRMYANTFIVFFVSGFWHGAAWTFVVWGIMHGIAMVISKLLKQCRIVLPKVLGWLLTFSFWIMSFAVFRAPSLATAKELFSRLWKGGFGRIYDGFYEQIEKHIEVTLLHRLDFLNVLEGCSEILVASLIGISLFACLIMKNTQEKLKEFRFTYSKLLVTVFLLFYSILSLESVTVFLYANF